MKPPGQSVVRQLITQSQLVKQLSKVRYPNSNQEISSATLSRWRQLVNLKPRKLYTFVEAATLTEVANLANRGCSYEEIARLLGIQNHGQSNSQSRNRSPRQSATQPQYSDNIWDF